MTSLIKNNNKAIKWKDLPINKKYKIIDINDVFKSKFGNSYILTLSDKVEILKMTDKEENIIKVWTTNSLLKYLDLLLKKDFLFLKIKNLKHYITSFDLKNCNSNYQYFSFKLETYTIDSKDGLWFCCNSYRK